MDFLQNDLNTFNMYCEMYWYNTMATVKNTINRYTDAYESPDYSLKELYYWFDWKNIIISKKKIIDTMTICRRMPYEELKKKAKRHRNWQLDIIFMD